MATVGLRACGAPLRALVWCARVPSSAWELLRTSLLALGSGKWASGNEWQELRAVVGFNTSNHIYGSISKSKENCSYFSFFLFSGLFWSCWSTPWAIEDPLTVTWGGVPGTFHNGICGWTLFLRLTQFYDCLLPESKRERTSVFF